MADASRTLTEAELLAAQDEELLTAQEEERQQEWEYYCPWDG